MVPNVEKAHIIKLKEERKISGRYKKCYCMNNEYNNDSCNANSDIIEDQCSNVGNNMYSTCNQN